MKVIYTLFLIIISLIISYSYSYSKETDEVKREITIKADRIFNFNNINQTVNEEFIKLYIEYHKDGSKEELTLYVIKNKEENTSTNDTTSKINNNTEVESTRIEGKVSQIEMNLIEKAINEIISKYTKESEKTISKVTLIDIYTWIYTTIYADGNIPKAGTFHVTNRIKFYTDNSTEKDNSNLIENLLNQENKIIKQINKLNQEIKQEVAKKDNSIHDSITYKHLYKIVHDHTKIKDKKENFIIKQLTIVEQFINDKRYDSAGLDLIQKDLDSIIKKLVDNESTNLAKQELLYTLKKIKANKLIPEINFSPFYDYLIKHYRKDIITIYNIVQNQEYLNKKDTIKTIINTTLKDTIDTITTWNSINKSIIENTEQVLQLNNEKITAIDNLINYNITFKKKEITNLESQLTALQNNIRKENIINIKKIDLQLERGFLENVKVIADMNGAQHIFENMFAIGFTSKKNYSDLSKIKLFNRDRSYKNHYIYLGDVIALYDNNIDLYTRDYSPADTNISIDPNKLMTFDVYKADFSNLFDVKFFTDLTAISENQPNGLVQFEVSRKLNINTFRFQQSEDINIGGFNYLYLFGSFNKIESNNRELFLRNNNTLINNQVSSPNYATAMDLLQFRNINYGFELNTLLLDWPNAKTTFTIDIGAQYGQTPLSSNVLVSSNTNDTLKNISIPKYANMLMIYPKLTAEIFSERRLGLTVSYAFNNTQFFTNNKFKPIVSYAKSDTEVTYLERNARWSHTFEANIRAELNEDGTNKIFLRTRIFWQQGDVNTYFPQIQIGYSTFLKIPKI